MNRPQLEHILRAAGSISGCREIVVLGSQAILATAPDAPAILPENWKKRLIRVATPGTEGTVGWCLSPVDLAASKLLAGRGKDMAYVRTMLEVRLVSSQDIEAVASELTPDHADLMCARVAFCLRSAGEI